MIKQLLCLCNNLLPIKKKGDLSLAMPLVDLRAKKDLIIQKWCIVTFYLILELY